MKDSSIDASPPARKRPNASATEKAWRAETWGKSKGAQLQNERVVGDRGATQPSSNWDDASIGLAQELQQFAIEESRAQEERAQNAPTPAKLKFQPRLPKPRQPKDNAVVALMTKNLGTHNVLHEDGDYVVDTYVRSELLSVGKQEPFRQSVDPLQGMDSNKIGILVIEEGEEELWDTFADEQESEAEVNSDEEDENGLSLTFHFPRLEC